jgi:hypothetical protein
LKKNRKRQAAAAIGAAGFLAAVGAGGVANANVEHHQAPPTDSNSSQHVFQGTFSSVWIDQLGYVNTGDNEDLNVTKQSNDADQSDHGYANGGSSDSSTGLLSDDGVSAAGGDAASAAGRRRQHSEAAS